jgi:hypothetical protein
MSILLVVTDLSNGSLEPKSVFEELYQTINVTELKGLLVTLSKVQVGVACIEQPQMPK